MDTIYYNAQDDEFWKDINDYEGLYMVSNLGRVKSLNYRNTGKEGMRALVPDCDGYLHVKLHKNGEKSMHQVHRLVMRAFVGECPAGYEVDHIDWNPSNNRLSNLSYQPKEENRARHSPEWQQKNAEKNKKLAQDQEWRKNVTKILQNKTPEWRKNNAEAIRKRCCKPVDQYTLDGKFVKRWPSVKDAARELGLKQQSISQCCNGTRKTTGGFKWQHATKI